MSTEFETEDAPRAACPACGEITLEAMNCITLAADNDGGTECGRGTYFSCQAPDCDYTHTIGHQP